MSCDARTATKRMLATPTASDAYETIFILPRSEPCADLRFDFKVVGEPLAPLKDVEDAPAPE